MSLFIKKLLYFLVFPVMFILVIDVWLRNHDTLYSEKYEGALMNCDSIEIMILGNSHANYGVDPNAFSLYAHNMANVGQSIYFDKRIVMSIVNKLENLKYVLISVDYHSLYFSSQGIRDIWSYYGNRIKYKERSYLLEDLSPFIYGYTPKVSLSLIKNKFIRYLKYGNDCISFNVESGVNLKDTLKRGFITYENYHHAEFFKNDVYNSRVSVFNEKIYNSCEKDEVLMDLEDFIKELIESGIEPILFTTPTLLDFNKLLDQDVIARNSLDIKLLCDKYDLRYLNFMNDAHFVIGDYYNADHLNKHGAYKFSKILSDSLMSVSTKFSRYGKLME